MRLLIATLLVAALAAPASAGCLARSQNAIAAVQIVNAYTISRYTWAGDPQYDQGAPFCAKTAIREFGCNIAVNIAIREAENHAAPDSKAVCIANYIGAAAFGLFIHNAIRVQIFSLHSR